MLMTDIRSIDLKTDSNDYYYSSSWTFHLVHSGDKVEYDTFDFVTGDKDKRVELDFVARPSVCILRWQKNISYS